MTAADFSAVRTMRWHGSIALAAWLLFAREAGADENANVRVEWNAPPECGSRDALLSDVRRDLGEQTRHTLDATVAVTNAGPSDWTASIVTTVDGAPGERTLHASSCDALERATALVLALAVDPDLATKASRPAIVRPPPAVPKPTETRREFHVVVAAGAIADTGALPAAGAGVEGGAGLLFGPIRVEASAENWWPQHAHVTSSEGTDIHLWDVGLRGCFRGRLTDALEIDPCAVGRVVFATSAGFGESEPFERSSSWANVGADVLASFVVVGPVAMRGGFGFGLPLVRPPFVILAPQGEIQLHRASFIDGHASIGVEARFP